MEFATGDLPPPAAANMTSNYQFGFDEKIGIPSAASLNDAWSTKHISSVEVFFKPFLKFCFNFRWIAQC